ncbi:MAG: glycosyltransferase family 39 protein, partial [Chloroflexota bacterium]|nr:glycosyltransferase family 39 protein [Chloroflexota bacterium]
MRAVVAVALVVRLLHVMLSAKMLVADDAVFFEQHARRFLTAWDSLGSDGFGTALREAVDHASLQGIVYPLFQSIVYGLSGGVEHRALLLVQAVLGTLTAGLTGLTAQRAFGRPAGLVAGTIAALYAPFVLADGLLLAESLLLTLQAVALYFLVRGLDRQAVGSRIVAGIAIGTLMLRPAFQYAGPVLFLVLLLIGWLSGRQRRGVALVCVSCPREGLARCGATPRGTCTARSIVCVSCPREGLPRSRCHAIWKVQNPDLAPLAGATHLAAPFLAGVLLIALPWLAMNGLVFGTVSWSRTGDAWQQVYWGIYPPNRGWWPPDAPVPPKYGVESLPGAWGAGRIIQTRDLDYLEAALDQVRATPLQAAATEVNKLYQAYLH